MDTQSHSPVSLPGFAEPLGSPSVRPLSQPSAISHITKTAPRSVRPQGESRTHAATIDMLPDNVLLEIFDFCQENSHHLIVWKWHLPTHVCRRWRQITFDSPHRLNLRIHCTHRTPVRKNLAIWPAFPIVVDYGYLRSVMPDDEDNVIAALEHPDRVCHLRLHITGPQLEKMATVMQGPFPVLTRLGISLNDGSPPALPAKFLGGSAPCLRAIYLYGVPFPALPTLLLSSTSNLVDLTLRNIPPAGYIPPRAVVACLAALPRLKTLIIEFQSAIPRPGRIHLPPATRTVLAALTTFQFRGASEYLEDLVSRIDSPQLNEITIAYFNQLDDFQAAQLFEYLDRSVGPKLSIFRHAQVSFLSDKVSFITYRHEIHPTSDWRPARTIISCQGIDWQVSHIAQVLGHFSATLATVVHLKLEDYHIHLEGTDDVEWLYLLRQFPAVQTLHVSRKLAAHVALALEDIAGEMAAEALPSLDLVYLAGQPPSSVEKFVAVRRRAGRPVTVVGTKTEFEQRLMSYVGR